MESSTRGNKLYSASINGDINLLNQLLEEDRFVLEDYGSSVGFCLNGTPLHIAATRGHVEFAKVLLHHKPQLVGERDYRSRTPLHLAVANGSLEMVQLLLEPAGREGNDTCLRDDEFGRKPLHLASTKGSEEIVKLKLQADNNVCLLVDELGRTPLHLAVQFNARLQVIRELVNAKPEAIAELLSSTKTVSILHSYVLRNGVDALQQFAGVDAFLCSQDEEGNTILHRIISLKKTEMLDCLIPKNQNNQKMVAVNMTNRNNLTPLDLINQLPKDPKTKLIQKRLNMHSSFSTDNKKWFDKKKNAIMVVATLIAGMSYQAGLSPPGGIFDDDHDNVVTDYGTNVTVYAGTSIMAFNEPFYYQRFWAFNTASFFAALSMVILLVHGSPRKSVEKRFQGYLRRGYMSLLIFFLWVSATCMVVAYMYASLGISQVSWVDITTIVAGGGFSWLLLMLLVIIIRGCYYFTWFIKKMVRRVRRILSTNMNEHGNNDSTTSKSCAFV